MIDIFKLLAALLVVCIHINPFWDFNSYVSFWLEQFLSRIAVPFFFVTAGFFCFKKTNEELFNIEITNSYAKRMLFLYSAWFVIYNVPQLVLTVKSFILGYSHLWYLSASAFSFFVLGIMFYKRIKIKTIFIVSALLYLIGLFGETYYGLIFNEDISFYKFSSRNGLFFAPIYIVLGAIYAYNKMNIKLSVSLIATMLFAALWAHEVILCEKLGIARDFNMSLFMVPTVCFLFNTLLKIRLNKAINTKLLRTISTHIYLVHMFILMYGVPILTKIISIIFNCEFRFNSLEKYIITVLGSIGTSFAVLKLQSMKYFKWLRKLY